MEGGGRRTFSLSLSPLFDYQQLAISSPHNREIPSRAKIPGDHPAARNRQDLRRRTTGVRTVRAEARCSAVVVTAADRRWWSRWKEGSKERSEGCERGRRAVECWRQLPRCCRINFGGPQTQTVSVDSIERFYRLPVPSLRLLSRLPRACRSIRGRLARSSAREDQFSSAVRRRVLRAVSSLSRASLLFSLCSDRNIISRSVSFRIHKQITVL